MVTNLFISLAFGMGQVLVGAAMIAYAARKARWRQITFFGLALLGGWIAASGITELVVSGTETLARVGQTFSAATAAQIRARADMAFLDASLALVAIGVGYLLLSRYGASQHKSGQASADQQNASSVHDGSEADQEQAAEAAQAAESTSAEPDE